MPQRDPTHPAPGVQGDLSLDHYDDSQHSRGSLNLTAGIGALGISNGSLSIRASSGFPRENSGGVSSGSAAPWGSGLGKGGEGGGLGGQHSVVPGGIWLPTPRTQGTSSFSPSSSTGAGVGVGGGGVGGGGGGVGRERTGDGGDGGMMMNAVNGGFFDSGSAEPCCARCSNTDAVGQAQVTSVASVLCLVLPGGGWDSSTGDWLKAQGSKLKAQSSRFRPRFCFASMASKSKKAWK